jgi:regulatory protein
MAFRRTSRSIGAEQRTDPQAARAAATALLARHDHPGGALRAKLASQGFDAAVVDTAVAELASEGVVNDERYAHNYVAYHAARGQGPVRIAAELKAMGLQAQLIELALASAPDWGTLARQARTARFGPAPPADWPEKARQARFLQYRGFSADHIRAATGADPDVDSTA